MIIDTNTTKKALGMNLFSRIPMNDPANIIGTTTKINSSCNTGYPLILFPTMFDTFAAVDASSEHITTMVASFGI
jgi:hypothetical protein